MSMGSDTRPEPAEAASAAAARLTPAERRARGEQARAAVPLAVHAEVPAERGDPVALLEGQGEDRVAALLPLRYERMLVSPFTFYRGAAALMADDLSRLPHTDLMAQLCGDAHLLNFGAFASPERNLVFDINDFDETHPGPWEWDVKRLAASLDIVARTNGLDDADRRELVTSSMAVYRQAMAAFAEMGNLAVWYARVRMDEFLTEGVQELSKQARRRLAKNLSKAYKRDARQAMAKLTEVVDGRRRILNQEPEIVRLTDLVDHRGAHVDVAERVTSILRDYRATLISDRRVLLDSFTFVDIARKVVGVGSVGNRAWIALFAGRDDSDPLMLQVKEAGPSVLAPYTPVVGHENQGQRVVEGQRLMQSASDIFLGWHRTMGLDNIERDFYVRQFRDWKLGVETEGMGPRGLSIYARLCAWTLAKAHARSGDRIAIAAYIGEGPEFDEVLADFAAAYADINERDFEAVAAAVATAPTAGDAPA